MSARTGTLRGALFTCPEHGGRAQFSGAVELSRSVVLECKTCGRPLSPEPLAPAGTKATRSRGPLGRGTTPPENASMGPSYTTTKAAQRTYPREGEAAA